MKKKTDFIEDEGVYDPELERELEEDRKAQEEFDRMVEERRMHNWERASILTQEMATRAMKAMATEFKLRIAQLLAIVAIAFILLAK